MCCIFCGSIIQICFVQYQYWIGAGFVDSYYVVFQLLWVEVLVEVCYYKYEVYICANDLRFGAVVGCLVDELVGSGQDVMDDIGFIYQYLIVDGWQLKCAVRLVVNLFCEFGLL